jgi:uncharacterized membrane protein
MAMQVDNKNKMETRPKLKLALSPFDRGIESLSKGLLLLMLGLTVYIFIKLPAIIPVHFGDNGQPDKYGKKGLILILPILATLIYFGLTQISKYPEVFNYFRKITNENAERQYTISTRMIRFLKIAILVVFTLVIFSTYLITTGVTSGIGSWFLPFVLGLIVIPTIVFIIQALTAKNSPG